MHACYNATYAFCCPISVQAFELYRSIKIGKAVKPVWLTDNIILLPVYYIISVILYYNIIPGARLLHSTILRTACVATYVRTYVHA